MTTSRPATRSFEGARLEDVLADVQQELGPDAAIVRADRRRSGGLLGFFARERFVVEAEVPAAAGDASPSPAGLLDLVAAADRSDRATVAGVAPVEASAPTAVSTERPGFADVLARLVQGAGPDPAPAPEAPLAPRPGAAVARPRVTNPVVTALAELGLPEALVPAPATVARDAAGLGAAVLDAAALVERLATLPAVPPLPRAGGVAVAVVGERAAALALAERLAVELDLDPAETLVATTARGLATVPPERRLASVAEVAAHRGVIARRARPTVVVVDAPVGRGSTGWAAHVLRALEPAAAWAVVDAWRKPEDLRAWAGRLGGVDAFAVDRLDETESPAAVLRAGIPVARLDDRPATALRWASLLADRLAAAGVGVPVPPPVPDSRFGPGLAVDDAPDRVTV